MPITSSFSGASARALGLTSSGYTAIGNGYWINRTSKASTNVFSSFSPIAIDSSGNTYYCGYSNAYPSGSDYSQNIVKYSSSGEVVWQRRLDTASVSDVGYTVTVDSSGNVYALGNANYYGSYAKYNSTGTLQWQKKLTDSYIYVIPYGSTVDSSGNFYMAGQTYNNTTDNFDSFIAKLDSSGAITWQRRLYTSFRNQFNSVVVDSSGNVYVCGYSETSSTSPGPNKANILKFNSSGTLQWQREMSSSYSAQAYSLTLDSGNNVYVAISCKDSSGGTTFGILAKYNTSGVIQWQNKITFSAFGGVKPTNSQAVVVDSSDNVYLFSPSGSYYSVGGVVVGSPALVQKFNSSGVEQWARNFNVNNESQLVLSGIKVSGTNLYLTNNISLSSGGSLIIAKLPTDGSKTGSYTVNGINITYTPEVTTTIVTGTLTDASGGMTDTAGALTSSTATLTDSANDLTVTVRD